MYDLLARKDNMESSYLMTKGCALDISPILKNDGLIGALIYYDGAFSILFSFPSAILHSYPFPLPPCIL